MITYGGIPLTVPSAQGAAFIASSISTADVYEFQDDAWPGYRRQNWAYPGHVPKRPIKIGSLYWPRGAANWSVAHFISQDSDTAKLRDKAYAGGGLSKLTLHLDDGTNSIETGLYMLPPRPLSRIGLAGMSLLTLVDDRYFWWHRSDEIEVQTGASLSSQAGLAWTLLYSQAASALGISITVDAIPGAYLGPSKSLTANYEFVPLLLDAIAYNVGQRIVRKLDGAVHAQSYDSAKRSLDKQLFQPWPIHSGGGLLSKDKAAIPPAKATLLFPTVENDEWCKTAASSSSGSSTSSETKKIKKPTGDKYGVTKTLPELGMPEYSGIAGFTGSKWWHDEAVNDGTNQNELKALAEQFAKDWYRFLLGSLDVVFVGVRPWIPEGLNGSVEWMMGAFGADGFPYIGTRIQRPEWNDLAESLNHRSSKGSLDVWGRQVYSMDVVQPDFPDGDHVFVENFLSKKTVVDELIVSNLTVLCEETHDQCDDDFTITAYEDVCENSVMKKYKVEYVVGYSDEGCLELLSEDRTFVENLSCCTNSFFLTAYDVDCEDGDLNKYELKYELKYIDGCLQINSFSRRFVERLGPCTDCTNAFWVMYNDVRCENSTLYKYRCWQLLEYVDGCLVHSGIFDCDHTGTVIACGVDCCNSSSSSSSSCFVCDCCAPDEMSDELYAYTEEKEGFFECLPGVITFTRESPSVYACQFDSGEITNCGCVVAPIVPPKYELSLVCVDGEWQLLGIGAESATLVHAYCCPLEVRFLLNVSANGNLCQPGKSGSVYLTFYDLGDCACESSSSSSSSSSSDCVEPTCGDPPYFTATDFDGPIGNSWRVVEPNNCDPPNSAVPPDLDPNKHRGETHLGKCACCGISLWYWTGTKWQLVEEYEQATCAANGTPVPPSWKPDYAFGCCRVFTACDCDCESSSSSSSVSSSSQSSTTDDDCGLCDASPSQWTFEIEGVSGSCAPPGPQDCDGANGTHVLDYQGPGEGACIWQKLHQYCAPDQPGDRRFTLSINGSNWELRHLSPGGDVIWTKSVSSWTCLSSNVMTKTVDPSNCSGFPATLTLTPV